MVAITTDSPRYIDPPQVSLDGPHGSVAPLRLAGPTGDDFTLTPLARVLLVLAAAAVVVAVAVASAAFGRMLDSQRGIPELGAAPAAGAQP